MYLVYFANPMMDGDFVEDPNAPYHSRNSLDESEIYAQEESNREHGVIHAVFQVDQSQLSDDIDTLNPLSLFWNGKRYRQE